MADCELNSRGDQFHMLMLHLASWYPLPGCALSMSKRSQQDEKRDEVLVHVKLIS